MAVNRHRRFGVVIGSVARGTDDNQSDFDYVRIGSARKIPQGVPTDLARRISVINYSWATFTKLYRGGSLFVYHILTEGILVEGDERAWEILKSRFKVRRSFAAEIRKNKATLRHILKSADTHLEPIPFLAHAMRCLKNIAIFSFARDGVYIFDKALAIREYFKVFSKRHIALMLYAESTLDREISGASSSSERSVERAAREIHSICRELPATK